MKATSRLSSAILAACALALAGCPSDPAEPVAPPAAPTGLTGTPYNGSVALVWNGSAGASTYNVYQSTIAGQQPAAMTKVGSGIGGTTFNVAAPNDVARYYQVTAVNSGGESPGSNEISLTASSAALPARPVGLTAAAGNTTVTLNWDDVPGATSYRVYWSTSPGVTTANASFTCTTSPCTHSGRTNGTTYYYAVTALISALESALSAEVSATPAAVPYIDALVSAMPASYGYGTYSVEVCADTFCNTPVTNATVRLGGVTLAFDGIDTYEGTPTGPILGATLQLEVTIPTGAPVAAGTYSAAATMYSAAPTITSPTAGAVWMASQSHTYTWTHASPTTSSTYALVDLNMSTFGLDLLAMPAITETSYTAPAFELTTGSHIVAIEIVKTTPVPIPNTASGSGITTSATDIVSYSVQ